MQPASTMTEYLTTKEAAELAGFKEDYMRYLAREGRVEAVRKPSGYWIVKASLLEYVERMRELGTQKFNWRRSDEEPTA